MAMVGGHPEGAGVFHFWVSAKLQKSDNTLGVSIFSANGNPDGKLALVFGELVPCRERAAARVDVGVGHVCLCCGLA